LRIDAHHEFSPRHTPEKLRAILERNRFDGSVAVVGQGIDLPTSFVLRDNLTDPAFARRLDEFQRDPRFRGICAPPSGEAGLAELARRGLPLDVEVDPPGLPQVARMAGRFPELRVAIDHLGRPRIGNGFDEEWARALEQAAQAPQVYAKLSGLITRMPPPWKAADLRPYVQHALAVFGPRRLMFGSDWPACLAAGSWKETLAAVTQSLGPLPMEAREELLGGTARRFYAL